MKKQKLEMVVGVIAIFFVLGACSNVRELEEIIESQEEVISDLNEYIAELEEQAQLVSNQQNEIEEAIETNLGGSPEWQHVLADDLMENIEDLAVEFLGGNPQIENKDAIYRNR